MAGDLPSELQHVLGTADPAARDRAWEQLVSAHSRLLLHVARTVCREHDAAMDAYAHILEALRRDDCRRLRAYTPDDRTKFTTWLVVVARRLCLDLERHKYGRTQSPDTERQAERTARRRLVDLVGADLDPDWLTHPSEETDPGTEQREVAAELAAALAALEPRERLLLRLRFEEDLGARDIAAALGFPTPFHVYRRLNALLRRLRESLRIRGIEGPGT